MDDAVRHVVEIGTDIMSASQSKNSRSKNGPVVERQGSLSVQRDDSTMPGTQEKFPKWREGDEADEEEPYVPSPDLKGDEFFDLLCTIPRMGIKYSGVEIVEITPGMWADQNGVELDDEVGSITTPVAVRCMLSPSGRALLRTAPKARCGGSQLAGASIPVTNGKIHMASERRTSFPPRGLLT